MRKLTCVGLGLLLVGSMTGCANMGLESLMTPPHVYAPGEISGTVDAVNPVVDMAVTTGLGAVSGIPVIGPIIAGAGGLLWRQMRATKRNRKRVRDSLKDSGGVIVNVYRDSVEKIKEVK